MQKHVKLLRSAAPPRGRSAARLGPTLAVVRPRRLAGLILEIRLGGRRIFLQATKQLTFSLWNFLQNTLPCGNCNSRKNDSEKIRNHVNEIATKCCRIRKKITELSLFSSLKFHNVRRRKLYNKLYKIIHFLYAQLGAVRRCGLFLARVVL